MTLLALFAAAVGAWIGYRGLAARNELNAARLSLGTARAALQAQDNDGARQAVLAAGARTQKAARLTSDPVFRAVAAVPVAGRSAQVARSVAATADELAREILPRAIDIARVVESQQVRRPDGSFDVALLGKTAPLVRGIAVRASRLESSTRQLPASHVLTPIRRGRDDFLQQLTELSELLSGASRALEVAPALLGADRRRTYFVMVQQTSESRGTGGLPGAFVVLAADGGRVTVRAQGSSADLQGGRVPVPARVPRDYVDLYQDNGAFDIWQNVNLSPNLPVVARVIAARWKQQSGQVVDGVASLDAIALADILRGTPPIDVGGRLVPPDGLPEFLALGQYRDFEALDRQAARKEKLSTVAKVAAERLTSGGGRTADLVRGVADAIRSGHLRLASDDPALGPKLRESGVDGALPAGGGPLAYPVVFNASGSKLDYFLDRSVGYTAGSCTGRRRTSRIAVNLTNRAPASGLPPYVTIFTNGGRTTSSYDNAVTLSVYATRGAQFVRATLDGRPIARAPVTSGGPFLSAGSEQGLPVWYVFLVLPRDQTRRLVLDLDEPVVSGSPRIETQPLARPLSASLAVPECR
jgi:hypothetical protein